MSHAQKNQISTLESNGRVILNRPWPSVQSTAGSRGVRFSGSNAGYSIFRGSVKGTGYPLHSTVSLFTSPPVRHRVPSHFNSSLKRQPSSLYLESYAAINWNPSPYNNKEQDAMFTVSLLQ